MSYRAWCRNQIGAGQVGLPGFEVSANQRNGRVDYQRYLASPHWRDMGEQIREWQGNFCAGCASNGRLYVHHPEGTYARLGVEDVRELRALCARCHALDHEWSAA